MRTLIVAQGLEKARIVAAISIHAPNKIIILRNTHEITDGLKQKIDMQLNALKEQVLGLKDGVKPYPFVVSVDHEAHQINFFDVVGSFLAIEKLILEEKMQGNDVFLDISSGNKTVAVAMFLAAQSTQRGITYCKASSYLDSPDQIAKDVKEPVHIPALPIYIQPLNYEILHKLAEAGQITSISDLLRLMNKKTEKSDIMSMARKLDELKEHGYIEIRRVGKRKEITITPHGKQVAGILYG